MNIRSWLRRNPQPTTVRCDERVVQVPPEGARKWADLEATILTLNPTQLVALDASGNVLRACELAGDGEVDALDAVDQKMSEREREVTTIARIIADSSDRAAQRHAAAYEASFTHMVNLVSIIAARLTGMENAWQQAMQAAAEARAEAASAGSAEEQMAVGLLTNMMNPGGAAKPAKKEPPKAAAE